MDNEGGRAGAEAVPGSVRDAEGGDERRLAVVDKVDGAPQRDAVEVDAARLRDEVVQQVRRHPRHLHPLPLLSLRVLHQQLPHAHALRVHVAAAVSGHHEQPVPAARHHEGAGEGQVRQRRRRPQPGPGPPGHVVGQDPVERLAGHEVERAAAVGVVGGEVVVGRARHGPVPRD